MPPGDRVNAIHVSRPIQVALSEKDLQSLTESDLKALEDGLLLIDHYVPVGTGVVDSFCLDKDANPVVVEYKAVEDADRDALVQALDYAAWVERNPDTLLRFVAEKRPGTLGNRALGDVRIILVAPSFSPRTRFASEMVKPDISLQKYVCFEHPNVGRWLHFESVYDSRITRPRRVSPQAYTIEDHFEGSYAKMRPVYDAFVKRVQASLGTVNIYAKQDYIAFQRNYIFAVVNTYINKIDVGVVLRSPASSPRLGDATKWGWSRLTHYFTITSERDIDDEVLKWIGQTYANS